MSSVAFTNELVAPFATLQAPTTFPDIAEPETLPAIEPYAPEAPQPSKRPSESPFNPPDWAEPGEEPKPKA